MGSLSFLFLLFFLSFPAFSLVYSSIFCTSSGSESFMQAASLLSRVWRMKFLEVAKTMSRVGTASKVITSLAAGSRFKLTKLH